MNKWLLLIPLFMSASHVAGQFTDNFSDGEFSNNPTWVGDTSKFIISDSLALQLNSSAEAGEAYLLTASNAIINGSWECLITMDFNPSSANKTRFIIGANTPNLNSNFNGYYIELGGSNDEISFYKTLDGNTTKLIDGLDDMLDASQVITRIKLTNDSLGNWSLFADTAGNENFRLIGSVTDNEITTCRYTGIWCDYTSTRANKFWFDDFVVSGDTLPDLQAPSLLSKQLNGDSLLLLSFDETIDTILQITIEPTINFTPSFSDKQVAINFNTGLNNGLSYSVSLSNVQDENGNTMADTTFVVQYLKPSQAAFRDVVFNELMADPSPAFDLPEEEFIELYNASNKIISLKDWSLVNSGNAKNLPDYVLLPNQFVLLASSTAIHNLDSFGDVIGISGWVALSNAGDDLQLLNNEQQIIDELVYSDQWHTNDTAKSGGWTLEQIDPLVTCTSASNWTSSKGSPNDKNKHYRIGNDDSPPAITNIVSIDKHQLVLEVSESIAVDLLNAASIYINPIATVLSTNFDSNKSLLEIGVDGLQLKTSYTINVQLSDCSGNTNIVLLSEIYVPETIQKHDLIFNELLFNPYPNGVDFVEVVNVSNRYLDLSALKIGAVKENDTLWSSSLSENYHIIAPQQYQYFAEDSGAVSAFYVQKNAIQVASLPAMNDDAGHLILSNDSNLTVDEIRYQEDDHLAAINNPEGISLEKINPAIVSNTTNENWHSAASSIGYATPGYENSQYNNSSHNSSDFTLGNTRISPNNDGVDDLLTMHINTSPGLGTITIFNMAGQIVKTLHHQIILGQANTLYWDGLDDDGQLTPVGNYIIVAELILENGKVKHFKEAFAVVTNE